MKKILLSLLAVILTCTLANTSYIAWAGPEDSQSSSGAVPPLFGDITRNFDPPQEDWNPGHRGVDIAGHIGDEIVAAMDGIVTFCGSVAGKPVVSISHGDVSTTYEPVICKVSVGQFVKAGDVIGTLEAGHPCPAEACLHWGLKQGDKYLDPLALLEGGEVRLISGAALDKVREDAANVPTYESDGEVSDAGFTSPASGPITSAYGMRLHPISHTWRFHDGMDIGASCGSPISAAASGTVATVEYSSSYGNHLVIDHGAINGHTWRTGYAHAQGFIVSVGDWVEQGQTVGYVGATGDATGCHLHFQVWEDGSFVDPAPLLP